MKTESKAATVDSKMPATEEPLKITERRQRAGQRAFGYGHNGNSSGFLESYNAN